MDVHSYDAACFVTAYGTAELPRNDRQGEVGRARPRFLGRARPHVGSKEMILYNSSAWPRCCRQGGSPSRQGFRRHDRDKHRDLQRRTRCSRGRIARLRAAPAPPALVRPSAVLRPAAHPAPPGLLTSCAAMKCTRLALAGRNALCARAGPLSRGDNGLSETASGPGPESKSPKTPPTRKALGRPRKVCRGGGGRRRRRRRRLGG
jgi:hypothetical protein